MSTQSHVSPSQYSILNAVSDGVTVQDANNRLIYANDVAARLLGYSSTRELLESSSEAILQRFEMLDELGQPFPLNQLPGRIALRGAAPDPVTVRFRIKATSEEQWATLHAQALVNDEGEVVSVVNTFHIITALKQAEINQHFLVQAGELLASSLEVETTLQHIAELAVPRVADWCRIDVLNSQGKLEMLALAHIDPEQVAWIREINDRYPVNMDDEYGAAKVLRTGQSEFLPDIPDELLVAAALDAEHLAAMRRVGYRGAMVIPLNAHGRIFGLLVLVTSHRPMNENDLWVGEELGKRASLALDNARLHQEAVQQRERLQVTLNSIGDAVIATNTRGQITLMNPIAEQLTGWTEQEAVGLPLEQVFVIVNETSRQLVDSPVAKVLREGTIVGLANHTVLITRDGREIPIDDSGAPIRGEQAQIIGVVLVFRDVSERKRRLQQMEQLQQLTAALSQALTIEDIGHVLMRDGSVLLNSYSSLVGLLNDDQTIIHTIITSHIDHHITEYVRDIEWDAAYLIADVVRRGEAIWITDREEFAARYPLSFSLLDPAVSAAAGIPLIHQDRVIGALMMSFASAQPFDDEQKVLLRTLATLTAQALDRARLYEREHAARLEAEQANQLKMAFLGMISHELRTPLASIKGFSSTLLSTDAQFDEESQTEFLRVIDEEADKLTELVEQLLDVSRLQGGMLKISPQMVNFDQILQTAHAQLNTLTVQHTLVVELETGLPPVLADVQRIAQVLVNLVDNSVKYSPPQTLITLSVWRQGEWVQVDVRDCGMGIAPEHRQLVFETFRQVGKRSTLQRGAGLGLAICKGLVEAHGGRIWIQNTSPPGTLISFTLSTK